MPCAPKWIQKIISPHGPPTRGGGCTVEGQYLVCTYNRIPSPAQNILYQRQEYVARLATYLHTYLDSNRPFKLPSRLGFLGGYHVVASHVQRRNITCRTPHPALALTKGPSPLSFSACVGAQRILDKSLGESLRPMSHGDSLILHVEKVGS